LNIQHRSNKIIEPNRTCVFSFTFNNRFLSIVAGSYHRRTYLSLVQKWRRLQLSFFKHWESLTLRSTTTFNQNYLPELDNAISIFIEHICNVSVYFIFKDTLIYRRAFSWCHSVMRYHGGITSTCICVSKCSGRNTIAHIFSQAALQSALRYQKKQEQQVMLKES